MNFYIYQSLCVFHVSSPCWTWWQLPTSCHVLSLPGACMRPLIWGDTPSPCFHGVLVHLFHGPYAIQVSGMHQHKHRPAFIGFQSAYCISPAEQKQKASDDRLRIKERQASFSSQTMHTFPGFLACGTTTWQCHMWMLSLNSHNSELQHICPVHFYNHTSYSGHLSPQRVKALETKLPFSDFKIIEPVIISYTGTHPRKIHPFNLSWTFCCRCQ